MEEALFIEYYREKPLRPHTPEVVEFCEKLMFVAFSSSCILLSCRLGGVRVLWKEVFTPLFLAESLCILFLIFGIFAPFPYIRQICELGLARIGKHPSGTELIPILLGVVGRIICLLFLLPWQIMLSVYLDNNTSLNLIEIGIPLYIVLFLIFLRGILIITNSAIAILTSTLLLAQYIAVIIFVNETFQSYWMLSSPTIALLFLSLLHFICTIHLRERTTMYNTFTVIGFIFALIFCIFLTLHIQYGTSLSHWMIYSQLYMALLSWSYPILVGGIPKGIQKTYSQDSYLEDRAAEPLLEDEGHVLI